MSSLYDAMDNFAGSAEINGMGQAVLSDQVGRVSHVIEQGVDGMANVQDSMGHFVMGIQDSVPGIRNITNSAGQMVGSIQDGVMGQQTLHDFTGTMQGSFDPMTGNMSNGIGQIVGTWKP